MSKYEGGYTQHMDYCPIANGVYLFGRKWVLPIICSLYKNTRPLRYNELRRSYPDISNVVLTGCLKELEINGLVKRTQYNEIPPRVEYSLTETAYNMFNTLGDFGRWSLNQLQGSEIPARRCKQYCFEVAEHRKLTDRGEVNWDEAVQLCWDTLSQKRGCLTAFEQLKQFSVLVLEDYLRNNYSKYPLNTLSDSNGISSASPLYRIVDSCLTAGREDRSICSDASPEDVVAFLSTLLKAIPDHALPCFEREKDTSMRLLSIFLNGLRPSLSGNADPIGQSG